MEQEKEPLLVINPRFNAIYYFLNKHFLTLVVLIFFMIIALQFEGKNDQSLIVYFLIAIAFYLVYVLIKGFLIKKQYHSIRYIFYDDKVLTLDRRKGHQDSVIYYNETFDIIMTQNIIQKFFNQGDLVLKLSESKIFSKNFVIFGIGNYEKTTQKLATIIYGDQQQDENI